MAAAHTYLGGRQLRKSQWGSIKLLQHPFTIVAQASEGTVHGRCTQPTRCLPAAVCGLLSCAARTYRAKARVHSHMPTQRDHTGRAYVHVDIAPLMRMSKACYKPTMRKGWYGGWCGSQATMLCQNLDSLMIADEYSNVSMVLC